MRAPLMALAAVCVAATASVIVMRSASTQKKLPAGKAILFVNGKEIKLKHTEVQAEIPITQTVLSKQNVTHSSKCNIAFIKPAQTQTAFISGTEDTIVRFSQGTEIKVDPSQFVSERTGQPIAGAVKLQVKEFYTMEDILLHDLSTSTKDGLLETNGMINIQAFAANGEACKLKKDGSMEIHFSKKNDKPGMELFTGIKKEDGTIIWQPLLINASVITNTTTPTPAPTQTPATLAKTVPVKKKIIDTTLNTIAEFEGGLKGIEKNINSIKNPFPIKNSNALVIADFNIDTAGYVCWVGKVAGNDEQYYELLGSALYNMPEWKPALVKGREKLMTMRLTVSFQVTNPRLMQFWSCVKSPKQNTNIIERRRGDGLFYDYGYGRAYQESYAIQTLNYYAFSTSNLGWINCDRFYNLPNTTEMYVAEPVQENTSLKLVFHNIKSVINATIVDGKYSFGKLPAGEAVTLVILKGEKDKLRMAVKNMNISNITVSDLDFKSVTKEDVRSTMAQFNKLPGAVAKN